MRQRHCIQCLFSFNVKPVGSEARADWWTVHAAFDSRARSNPGSACKGTTAATMSLRRAVTRTSELLSLRKTSQRDQLRLGSYPVPPEAYIWWCNRSQVPGGEIKQTFSHFQQKIMWQWFWNAPTRWYWRLSSWAWPVGVPALLMYIFVYKSCECD
ncbi:Uncharacterized protein SCF082_LOCUS45061, partial [Durusdinium trenchii]